jgi:hypothetical protein
MDSHMRAEESPRSSAAGLADPPGAPNGIAPVAATDETRPWWPSRYGADDHDVLASSAVLRGVVICVAVCSSNLATTPVQPVW